ncbi:MAG: Wzz/FepE/Etk N-terminal domain-containing protein [Actinomycetota bacterium]
MADEHDSAFDVLDSLDVLFRHKWIIVGLATITLAAALLVSYLKDPVYTSTGKVLVKPIALNPPGSVPLASVINMPTEVEVVRSLLVAEIAAKELSEVDPQVALGRVSATFPADSQIMLISYSDAEPAAAQAGAQAFSTAYLEFRSEQAAEAASAAIEHATSQIASLKRDANAAAREAQSLPPASSGRTEAENRAAQLNGQIAGWENSVALLNIQAVDAGQVLVPAGRPVSPSSPNHRLDAIRGLLLGLGLGVAGALVVDRAAKRRRRSPP